jgi:hypothetical protein
MLKARLIVDNVGFSTESIEGLPMLVTKVGLTLLRRQLSSKGFPSTGLDFSWAIAALGSLSVTTSSPSDTFIRRNFGHADASLYEARLVALLTKAILH